ncbi:hypothetical protein Cni_G03504 [Canna indica]|uniref:phospholipase A2 n=1 Tax=Canna indica TaxID=4628 RepID=A0AAQ3JTK9_9LILI|nr:hypothetical protein Cni_G03504 [Canna indica]
MRRDETRVDESAVSSPPSLELHPLSTVKELENPRGHDSPIARPATLPLLDAVLKGWKMQGQRGRARALAACLLLLLVLLYAFVRGGATTHSHAEVNCSKRCVAENCNTIGIRYGKFCGVGWTGCPGEKPCDELDACCKIHDECVEKKGMMSVRCHEKFKTCMKKVKKSGKIGFSKECSYEKAMPTMIQGMDMAILFSQLGSQKAEL